MLAPNIVGVATLMKYTDVARTETTEAIAYNLLPEQAMGLTAEETLHLLRRRLGDAVDLALAHAGPGQPARDAPQSLQSPVAGQPDGRWLRQSNMVGINVRTIGSFWNVVKYTLTLPHIHSSIHLLPIWEPGVVGSLYGISSWNLNTEFYSPELAQVCPQACFVVAGNKRDLVAEYVEACHAEGLKVGFYYSLMDWHHPDGARCATDEAARRRFLDFTQGCVRELCSNYGKIDIFWHDVSWPLPWRPIWNRKFC